MKCPIRTPELITFNDGTQELTQHCIKEECAWWDLSQEKCSMLVLSKFVSGMGINLAAIVNKMPHEEQFRK